jgi:hypothetical protein
MPRAGFEPTIPVFERAKTVHALDGVATVIGLVKLATTNYDYDDKLETMLMTQLVCSALPRNLPM